jgi:hypothetical protein
MVGYVEAKLAILKKFRTRVVKKSENQLKNLPWTAGYGEDATFEHFKNFELMVILIWILNI